MLTSFADLLASRREGTAVGAFTCYDLEAAGATLRAATGAGTGVILLIGGRSYTDPGGGLLLAALVAAARASEARACVQLDHCADLAVIESALEAGAGAVMADGSELPYDENAAFVERAGELARRHSAGVEAELGHLSGDEDVATAVAAGALTDPAEAADFVARTGADCLAVSIGNVHGTYRGPPRLDWDRLEAIRSAIRRRSRSTARRASRMRWCSERSRRGWPRSTSTRNCEARTSAPRPTPCPRCSRAAG